MYIYTGVFNMYIVYHVHVYGIYDMYVLCVCIYACEHMCVHISIDLDIDDIDIDVTLAGEKIF